MHRPLRPVVSRVDRLLERVRPSFADTGQMSDEEPQFYASSRRADAFATADAFANAVRLDFGQKHFATAAVAGLRVTGGNVFDVRRHLARLVSVGFVVESSLESPCTVATRDAGEPVTPVLPSITSSAFHHDRQGARSSR
jgi:hypothetical protein